MHPLELQVRDLCRNDLVRLAVNDALDRAITVDGLHALLNGGYSPHVIGDVASTLAQEGLFRSAPNAYGAATVTPIVAERCRNGIVSGMARAVTVIIAERRSHLQSMNALLNLLASNDDRDETICRLGDLLTALQTEAGTSVDAHYGSAVELRDALRLYVAQRRVDVASRRERLQGDCIGLIRDISRGDLAGADRRIGSINSVLGELTAPH